MKNVLFASTALVAFGFAGASFAQNANIAISGDAELGLTYQDTDATEGSGDAIRVHNDYEVSFALTGVTDGGISFGATGVFLDDSEATDTSAFISGAFGTITGGDTNGAFDQAMIEVAGGGLADEADFYLEGSVLGTVDLGDDGFDGAVDDNADNAADITGDAQIIRYDLALAAATFSVSYEDGEDEDGGSDVNAYGIGANFDLGDFANVGIAYQTLAGDGDLDGSQVFGISGSTELGGVELTATYSFADIESEANGDDEEFNIAASAEFSLGAAGVGVNIDYNEADETDAEALGYGAFMEYDLGGGADFVAAIGYQETEEAGSDDVDELRVGAGIGMSF
ncbi:porin [Pontivivens ytuae]|uniref:Porin n=1 Tax=Pontivivens ytuae TaxID=2789856 RepID=A0A7S9QDM8_9RHOB|nr:porin [Pontivivens ytuae]QPH55443.1 porin [Pontivivens ytuae]